MSPSSRITLSPSSRITLSLSSRITLSLSSRITLSLSKRDERTPYRKTQSPFDGSAELAEVKLRVTA